MLEAVGVGGIKVLFVAPERVHSVVLMQALKAVMPLSMVCGVCVEGWVRVGGGVGVVEVYIYYAMVCIHIVMYHPVSSTIYTITHTSNTSHTLSHIHHTHIPPTSTPHQIGLCR